jgi:hypothetical protein
MQDPRMQRFPLVRPALLCSLALVASAFGQDAPAQDAPPKEGPRRGEIIREAVNPYAFRPAEDAVTVDAASANLRQLFEDLGADAIEWYQHVQTLSNPWFEGRAPGSEGHDRAVDYVEWWMRHYGLSPAFTGGSAGTPPSYRQTFELTGRERQVRTASVTVDATNLVRGTDYAVMGSSGTGSLTAPLAFAGYAISAGEEGYTSFDGDEDIRGRVVLFMRYEPLDAEGKSRWAGNRFSQWSNLGGKLAELAKRGAAAIVMINPPGAKEGKTELESLRTSRWGNDLSIPFIQIDADRADAIVRKADPEGRGLLDLRKLCDEGTLKDFAMRDSVRMTLEVEVGDGSVPATNVAGVLEGKGSLKDEWVVIGGHLDHVGMGQFGSDPANRGQLHPGADDNASGTAAVIILARQLAAEYEKAGDEASLRSVLFIGFSAEESGLDGSRYFARNPSVPVDRMSLMLNLDMIGRLRSDTIAVGGTESGENLMAMLEPIFRSSGLEIHADPSGRGPSDHASFFNAGVPVLFFFTGTHDIYHRPGDKGHTVNPAGAVKVMNLVRTVALAAAKGERIRHQSGESRATPDRGYAAVRLGVMPGMGDTDVDGVLVESVSADTSAADAGIRPGDIMLSWNGKEMTTTGEMMANLREHKPGDEVIIRIRRDGKEMDLTVKLKAGRPRGE